MMIGADGLTKTMEQSKTENKAFGVRSDCGLASGASQGASLGVDMTAETETG